MNKVKLQNSIYKKIFLDKKKLDKYPRFISVKNISKTSPKNKGF